MKGGDGKINAALDQTTKALGNKYMVWIVTLLALAGIIMIFVFIMRSVLKSSLEVSLAYNDIVSGNGSAVTVPASKLADLANGSEFGYSFWVYSQSGAVAATPRFILSHGGSDGGKNLISMNREANELNFSVAGATSSIRYLPMNRWVHVVAVYANGVVTFFVDGEVHSTHGLPAIPKYAGPSGEMVISGGAEMQPTEWSGFKGYVGHVSYMNFYPSPGLVKRLYAKGPTSRKGWLSIFGIQGYGFRNPVYRLNTVRTADEKGHYEMLS
jgi:hypothetical protein